MAVLRVFRIGRNGVLLAVALVAGLMAAWFARSYIQEHILELDEQAKVKTVRRIVADYDLPEGLRLDRAHLAVREMPATWVPSGSIAPDDVASVEGRVVSTSLRKGDVLLWANLTVPRHAPFSQKVREGRRAISIPVDVINSVSGMLVPGDLIDLYVSFEYRKKRITAPLLQGVLVLATGSQTRLTGDQASDETGQYSTVTLDTSPEEAARLVAARQSGTLTALLRHPDDAKTSNKGVQGDLATLLGISKPIAAAKPHPSVVYGNQQQRKLPSLAQEPGVIAPDTTKGLIDLPESADIVSAWINSLPGVRDENASGTEIQVKELQ